MNDAAESIYFFDVLYESLVQLHNEEIRHKDMMSKFFEIIWNKVKEIKSSEAYANEYMLSFSLNSDSLSMWNYYGKNDGYCVGLSSYEMMEKLTQDHSNSKYIPYTVKVVYDKGAQISILKQETYKVFYWYIANMSWVNESYREKLAELLFESSPHLEETKYRIYQGILAPYIAMDFTKNDNSLPINSITVGQMVKDDLALESLSSWLSQLKDFLLSKK